MPLTLVRRAGGYEHGSAGIAVTFLFGTTPSLGCVQGLVGCAIIDCSRFIQPRPHVGRGPGARARGRAALGRCRARIVQVPAPIDGPRAVTGLVHAPAEGVPGRASGVVRTVMPSGVQVGGSEARVVAGATSAENGCRNDDGQENGSTHGKILGCRHRRHVSVASGDDTTTQWRTGRDYVTQTDWAGVQRSVYVPVLTVVPMQAISRFSGMSAALNAIVWRRSREGFRALPQTRTPR